MLREEFRAHDLSTLHLFTHVWLRVRVRVLARPCALPLPVLSPRSETVLPSRVLSESCRPAHAVVLMFVSEPRSASTKADTASHEFVNFELVCDDGVLQHDIDSREL